MINLVTENDRYRRCCWCAKTGRLNLFPCLKTTSLMFCSLKCRNETYKKMPDRQLCTLIDDSDGKSPLIFAAKFKKYLQKCLFDSDLSKGFSGDIKRLLKLCNIKRKEDGAVEPYTKIFHFTYYNELLNYGYSLVGSLFKHSCEPNVAVMTVDNKFIFYVTKPIRSGETLEICYGTEYFYLPRVERAEYLYKMCSIICTCKRINTLSIILHSIEIKFFFIGDACIRDYPVYVPRRESFISPMTQNSLKLIMQSLHQQWNYINREYHKGAHNEKEMCTAFDMVWQLMQEVGHYLTYGFFGPLLAKHVSSIKVMN